MVREYPLLMEFFRLEDCEIAFYPCFQAAPPQVLHEVLIVVVWPTGNRYPAPRVENVDDHLS